VYESRLKADLEAEHRDRFVAIEPVSESYFLGDQFIDVALAAKKAYPDRKSFVHQDEAAAGLVSGFRLRTAEACSSSSIRSRSPRPTPSPTPRPTTGIRP
jgi:hypothetical protein